MKNYELLLKNEKTRSYDRIATLIILLNLALFILLSIYAVDKRSRISSQAAAFCLATLLLLPFFFKRAKNSHRANFRMAALLLTVLVWMFSGYWWFAIACFLLAWLYRVSARSMRIRFSPESILYTGFPKRILTWEELANVILKDGIVTIDFKNNRILQAEICETDPAVIETEFNDFCRQQLKPATV